MKIKTKKQRLLFEAICVGVGLCILIGLGWILKGGKSPLTTAKSHTSVLPVMSPPGEMLSQSSDFTPTVIKGLKVYPDKPFHFDFIVDNGDSKLKDKELEAESIELVKYFLAALTTPEDDLWVNLSPYEQDRIVPEDFGQTSMGRDLLAQDYILKQLMSSLTYPESELGKKFWQKVYAKAQEKLGTTNIPVNTFNKVWIIPDKAIVYEGEDTAYIVDSHLKVMLEEDYVALRATDQRPQTKDRRPGEICGISSKIMREIVLPVLEQEINQGENFAQLRQIYNSLILALWYKENLTQSLLNKNYSNQNKTKGIDVEDKQIKQKIYNQYVEAYKKGVYDYIKKDYDPASQRALHRRYFSGGFEVPNDFKVGISNVLFPSAVQPQGDFSRISVEFARLGFAQKDGHSELPPDEILAQYRDKIFGKDGANAFVVIGGSVLRKRIDSYDFTDDEKLLIGYIANNLNEWWWEYMDMWGLLKLDSKEEFLSLVVEVFSTGKIVEDVPEVYFSKQAVDPKYFPEQEKRIAIFRQSVRVFSKYSKFSSSFHFFSLLMNRSELGSPTLQLFLDETEAFLDELDFIVGGESRRVLDPFVSLLNEKKNGVDRGNWQEFLRSVNSLVEEAKRADATSLDHFAALEGFFTHLEYGSSEFEAFLRNIPEVMKKANFEEEDFLLRAMQLIDPEAPFLRNIQIAQYGPAHNVSAAMGSLMLERAEEVRVDRPANYPVLNENDEIEVSDISLSELKKQARESFAIVGELRLEEALGRSIVFVDQEGNKLLIKLKKKGEPLALLDYEMHVMERMQEPDMGDLGNFPKPIKVGEEQAYVFKVDFGTDRRGADNLKVLLQEAEERSKQALGKGYQVDMPDIGSSYWGVAFFVPSGHRYTEYPHAQNIRDWQEFTETILTSARYLGGAARIGLVHTQLSELFHNFSQDRRYIMAAGLSPYSTGRQAAYLKSVAFPNVAADGTTRDMAEFRFIGDVLPSEESFGIDFMTFSERFSKKNNLLYYEFLSEYMNTFLNLTARWLSENDWLAMEWNDDRSLVPLAEFTRSVYIELLSSFLGRNLEKELEELGFNYIDWLRLARQMKFFMSNSHVEFLEPDLGDLRKVPAEVFGNMVDIEIGDYSAGWDSKVGFVGNVQPPFAIDRSPSIGAYSGAYSIQEFITANNILLASGIVKRAQGSSSNSTNFGTKGGVDFNPVMFNVQVKHDENKIVPLVSSQYQIQTKKIEIDGLFPVVINVTPVNNLPSFLGFLQKTDE